MKTLTQKLLLAAVIVLAATNSSSAQTTGASTTATASATIITPITIRKDFDLNFGDIAVTATDGTVVLAATMAGARTPSGGVTLPASAGVLVTPSSAAFLVKGEMNYTYAVTIPPTLTLAHSSDNMTVDAITASTGATGLLDGSGQQELYIGATLHVTGSQPSGTYTTATAFTVLVNYN
jgi:hypothetical protein